MGATRPAVDNGRVRILVAEAWHRCRTFASYEYEGEHVEYQQINGKCSLMGVPTDNESNLPGWHVWFRGSHPMPHFSLLRTKTTRPSGVLSGTETSSPG